MLMRLLMRALRDETDKLNRNNVSVHAIGEISALPREVRTELADAIERTRRNTGLNLHLALSYSGRWDITGAVRMLAADVRDGKVKPEDVTDVMIAGYLSTKDVPDPDLLVRTSGEFRISNFLLWQLAYSEIYISQLFWPDFRRQELYKAVRDYQQRERRFGLVSEQIQSQAPSSSFGARIIKSISR